MASRIGFPRRRYFDPSAGRTRERLTDLSQRRTVTAEPPFGGFTPDLSPNLAHINDAELCLNLVEIQQQLGLDDGWDRVDSARLPLGTNTPPAGAGSEEPVVGLINYREIVPPHAIRQFAITADSVLGHLYELLSGAWTNRAYVGAGAGLSGDPSGQGVQQSLIDWAYYTPDDIVVFTNHFDPVFQFPNVGAGVLYTDFNTGAFFGGPSPTLFQATSVETSNDRLLFLNTTESATNFPNRVRWTTVGGGASLDPTLAGAGFIDLTELDQGLRVENLGNKVACYFDNGVALLHRTLVPSEAFRREYLDHRRGLLGTHAMIPVARGAHFGIFDDGWWLLDDTGTWRALGLRSHSGKFHPLWWDTFYNTLNRDAERRVVIGRGRRERFLKIAFPSGEQTDPDTVWIYDTATDTVWPQDYMGDTPNIWGELDSAAAATPWSSFGAGDTWAGTPAAWGDFSPQVARFEIAFGTVGGLVFRGDEGLVLRDGEVPTYAWVSHLLDLGVGAQLKTSHKIHVHYRHLQNSVGEDAPAITTAIRNSDRTVLEQIAQTKGAVNSLQSDFTTATITGTRLGIGITGSGPIRAQALALEFEFEGNQEYREE